MRRSRLLLLIPLAVAAVLVPGSASGGPTAATLLATVGPGFTIHLQDAGGKNVTRVDPGAYTITVRDLSDLHSFHLTGPGVDKATTILGTGTMTWDVTFAKATYAYRCDNHPTTMKGSFRSGPPLPKLNGRVGPGRTISLKTAAGTLVKAVSPGEYQLTVRDSTKADNFHLLGNGVNKRTGVVFKGTKTFTVALKAATTYIYRSDAHPKLRRTFKVLGKSPPPPPPLTR